MEGDSQLIVRQLTGRYQCREPSLKKFFNACQEVSKHMDYFEIRHIPRAENKRADWLANHAMDVSASKTKTVGSRGSCFTAASFQNSSIVFLGFSCKSRVALIKFKQRYDCLYVPGAGGACRSTSWFDVPQNVRGSWHPARTKYTR